MNGVTTITDERHPGVKLHETPGIVEKASVEASCPRRNPEVKQISASAGGFVSAAKKISIPRQSGGLISATQSNPRANKGSP